MQTAISVQFLLRPVLQRLQQRILVQQGLARKVGHSAGYPQNAVMRPSGKSQCIVGTAQQLLGTGGHAADAPHLSGVQLGVAVHPLKARRGVALGLNGAGSKHLFAQLGAALGGCGGVQLVKGDGVHLHAQVDAVQKRAGHPAAVLPHRTGRAGAGAGGVAVVAAFAGVHGGYQLEVAGVGGASGGAAHGDLAVLQRLAQHL